LFVRKASAQKKWHALVSQQGEGACPKMHILGGFSPANVEALTRLDMSSFKESRLPSRVIWMSLMSVELAEAENTLWTLK
jgi:hypothetical protein